MKRVLPFLTLGVSLVFACKSVTQTEPVVAQGGSAATGPQPVGTLAEQDRPPPDDGEWGIVGDPSYTEVVRKVVGMVEDRAALMEAQRRGLGVVNVMWEDTGRAQGSALGPNISDLTLQVRFRNRRNRASAPR